MEKFPLISGHLALDLVNTQTMSHGKIRDHILNETDLTDWLFASKGYVPFIDDHYLEKIRKESFAVLDDLKNYRSFLRKCFEDAVNGRDVSERLVKCSEQKIDACPLTLRMISQHIHPYPVGGCRESLAALISVDVLKLIEDDQLRFMKCCANPECMLLFIDRTGKRKWCSMKRCGNRMKAARYRNE
ncbi:CGNR zinc finger domain-containing protein [Sporolactobacillus pectinivorans]|uniref:CGNR zinc finger domain-containing protein n=1 Tax=Sporolactobacillus pectinivorans TaxID=1591408 RepID=UPI0012FD8C4E|nr:CGNR zinc finger domain-containing protein [Sporolactobacillus pectinivorans]